MESPGQKAMQTGFCCFDEVRSSLLELGLLNPVFLRAVKLITDHPGSDERKSVIRGHTRQDFKNGCT